MWTSLNPNLLLTSSSEKSQKSNQNDCYVSFRKQRLGENGATRRTWWCQNWNLASIAQFNFKQVTADLSIYTQKRTQLLVWGALSCANITVFMFWGNAPWRSRHSQLPEDRNLNPFNAQLNTICHLLTLLGAHPILHISRIRVNQLISQVKTLQTLLWA